MHQEAFNSSIHDYRSWTSPAGLAVRHSRRGMFCQPTARASTSLRSLRSIPITGLHRYYGRSDSCWPSSSAPRCMNTGSCYQQVSLIHPHDLLIIPSPTTPVSPDIALARYPLARQASPLQGSGLRLSLAGSPISPGRIEFVIILRTDRSPPVAPHPVLRRRSYSRLQTGERLSGEDSHLSDRVRFQAHECGDLSPLSGAGTCHGAPARAGKPRRQVAAKTKAVTSHRTRHRIYVRVY